MKRQRTGDLANVGPFLTGRFSTAISRYVTGRYGLVGSIPGQLYDHEHGRSMIWNTEQQVIDALVGIGVTRFQLADCSWYQPAPGVESRDAYGTVRP